MSERNSKKTGWEYRTVWQGALRAALLITGAIEVPAYLAARGASRNRDAPPVFAAHLTRERNGGTISRACKNVRTVRSCYSDIQGVPTSPRNLGRCTMDYDSLGGIKMSIKYQQRSLWIASSRTITREQLPTEIQGWSLSKVKQIEKSYFTFSSPGAHFTSLNLRLIH